MEPHDRIEARLLQRGQAAEGAKAAVGQHHLARDELGPQLSE
jgi:hypothetical protein